MPCGAAPGDRIRRRMISLVDAQPAGTPAGLVPQVEEMFSERG